jgi:DNA polymerase elongation subunit (family B)
MECKVHVSNSELNWMCEEDNVWSTEYELPQFNNVNLKIFAKVNEGKIPRFTDSIASVIVQNCDTKDTIHIQGSEIDILYQLVKEIKKINPDFILTEDGDSFTFPYLTHRSEINQVDLILDREVYHYADLKKMEHHILLMVEYISSHQLQNYLEEYILIHTIPLF